MRVDAVKSGAAAALLSYMLTLSACTITPANTATGAGGAGTGGDTTGGTTTGGTDTGGTDNTPTGPNLVVFQDPDSAFTTSDVYDVNEEIVQFEADTKAILWAADGTAYQAGTWVTNENLLGATGFFQVRFGNVSGARRAFFTESSTATICDIRVTAGQLSIFATSVPVPQ